MWSRTFHRGPCQGTVACNDWRGLREMTPGVLRLVSNVMMKAFRSYSYSLLKEMLLIKENEKKAAKEMLPVILTTFCEVLGGKAKLIKIAGRASKCLCCPSCIVDKG